MVVPMTALAEAAVLALALRCAQGVAPDTVASIARVESGYNPLAIHDNTTQQTLDPSSPEDGITLATNLIVVQRHSVDLGLLQVNSSNLQRLGLTITEAFDACHSMQAGSRLLSDAYQDALRKALSAYNTGDEQRGMVNGYVRRVEHAATSIPSINPGAAVSPPPAAQPASRPAQAEWDLHAQSGGSQFVFR